MPQVSVTIAGKTYRMACDDGQEEHLYGLARRLDGTIDDLRGVFGEIGDQRLTVMSAITVLDQLSEAERKVEALQAELDAVRQAHEGHAEGEDRVAQRIAEAAERIEAVATALRQGV